MTDIDNRELKVGDRIAYITTHYSSMRIGYVVKLTPKGCNVSSRKGAESGLWRGSDQVCILPLK
ncbi:hypothetical protein CHOED_053 [Vibrio phage CHOED]|uniref:hypothetical protein n=1 Tax=Vibrio phage CHOED TaxID=1458716 RepID=UPI00042F626A|nr:hypothetical protein CHOED_053 [Vibrio phage CHOED]AHK11913.1 hypothetical protein CHOED_053 [Vibrio phage CHOED]